MSGEFDQKIFTVGERIEIGKANLPNPEQAINVAAYHIWKEEIKKSGKDDTLAYWCIGEGLVCLQRAREILNSRQS